MSRGFDNTNVINNVIIVLFHTVRNTERDSYFKRNFSKKKHIFNSKLFTIYLIHNFSDMYIVFDVY
jgi:hypothetical protein